VQVAMAGANPILLDALLEKGRPRCKEVVGVGFGFIKLLLGLRPANVASCLFVVFVERCSDLLDFSKSSECDHSSRP
jgi:hypothetical protein